jgi:hypothetical protein
VLETRYSLLTAFSFVPPEEGSIRYLVITDQPSAFSDLTVDTQFLDEATVRRWLNGDNYGARMKICSVQDTLQRFGGKVVFIDTDTFFKASPQLLFDRVRNGATLLHVAEGRASELTRTGRLETAFTGTPLHDSKGLNCAIGNDPIMWNSGVIGVDHSDAGLLQDALTILDQLRSNSPSRDIHTIEQFAVGVAFARGGRIREAIDVVYHYWFAELKAAFRNHLPSIVADNRRPILRDWGNAVIVGGGRPRPPLKRRLVLRLRDILRRFGLRVPGARASG